MKYSIAFIMLGTVNSMAASDIVDGSGNGVSASVLDAVSYKSSYPSATQFRNVHAHGDHVCGEISVGHHSGEYDGFTPFFVSQNGTGARIAFVHNDDTKEIADFMHEYYLSCRR